MHISNESWQIIKTIIYQIVQALKMKRLQNDSQGVNGTVIHDILLAL